MLIDNISAYSWGSTAGASMSYTKFDVEGYETLTVNQRYADTGITLSEVKIIGIKSDLSETTLATLTGVTTTPTQYDISLYAKVKVTIYIGYTSGQVNKTGGLSNVVFS